MSTPSASSAPRPTAATTPLTAGATRSATPTPAAALAAPAAPSAPAARPTRLARLGTALVQWFDADYAPQGAAALRAEPDRVDWMRCLPFVFLHVGCLGVFLTGWSWFAVGAAALLYFVRMFAVTGIYHRYFSHKTYKTSRVGQFLLALWGGTTVQRGPLWWAYHHRHHHQHSDDPEDAHSPHVHGFLWSHIGWITSRRNFPTDYSTVPDLARYPELVFLNRFDSLVPVAFAAAIYALGAALATWAPSLGTDGPQLLVWGFFISTTALFHGTSCINSLAHLIGRRRYATSDDSRNSWLLAFITLGEGWHNNHHRYQSATRNGFYWWEFDPTYYGLKFLSWTRLIWGLKPVPASVKEEGRRATPVPAPILTDVPSPLGRVVPAAAALAVASVTPNQSPTHAHAATPTPPAPTSQVSSS